ncbi:hypothetical protein GCM10027030_03060 [Luteococcus sediminum]
MARLVLAELRRLLHRQVTILCLVGVLLALGVTGWAVGEGTRPPTEQQKQEAIASYRQAQADWDRNGAQQIKDCQASNEEMLRSDPQMDRSYLMDCTAEAMAPRAQWYAMTPARMSDAVIPLPYLAGLLSLAAGMLAAGNFVGAEFTTGNIGSWLLVEPRRSRVVASKLAVVGLFTAVLTTVVSCLMVVGLWVIGQMSDFQQDLTGQAQASLLAGLGRGLVLAVAGTLAAAGLAFLFRHTVAVVSAVAVYSLFSVSYGNGDSWLQRFGLLQNLEAWFEGRMTYTVNVLKPGTTDAYFAVQHVLTRADAGLWLGGLALASIVLGWLFFTRRDVA